MAPAQWPHPGLNREDDKGQQLLTSPAIEEHRLAGTPLPPNVEQAIAKTRADYERWLDAQHAGARGYVDALISPLDTRAVLAFALEAACASGPQSPALPERS